MDLMLLKARISAYCLNLVCNELGLGIYAHKFSGEYADDWIEQIDHIVALIDHTPVAKVFIDNPESPKLVGIDINNIYLVVRPKALGEFDPVSHGIYPTQITNFMGDKDSDLVCDINITDAEIPGLHGPRRAMPRKSLMKTPKYYGSLSRGIH